MIPLKDKPNVVAPGGDYPYGRIKDAAGGNPGTLVNTMVYGDIHQFFEKLMDASGIVPNGLSDNETNGFQLFEAFKKVAGIDTWEEVGDTGLSSLITYNTGSATRFGGSRLRWKRIGNLIVGEFRMQFNAITGSPTQITINMPTGMRTSHFGNTWEIMARGNYRTNSGTPSGVDVAIYYDRFVFNKASVFGAADRFSFTFQFEAGA